MKPPSDWNPGTYDDLLSEGGPPSDASALRGAVLAATLPVVRRRRWVRRGATAALLAACYVAGLLSPLGRTREDSTTIATGDGADDAAVIQQPGRQPDMPPSHLVKSSASPKASPLTAPRRAEDRRTKYETFRDGGDRFLQSEMDLSSAVRGYAAALRSATADERALAPGRDTWLLLALKQAKLQEQSDDNPSSH